MEKCVHTYINGDVMNGHYRLMVKRMARRKGLKGWARPLVDGRIEAVFKGEGGTVDEMLDELEAGSLTSRSRECDRDDSLVQEVEAREIDESEVTGVGGFKLLHGARLATSNVGKEYGTCGQIEEKGRDWLRCQVYGYEPLEPRHCETCGGAGEELAAEED